MLRLFSLNFPTGLPGMGLLLLRATVGLTGLVQGGVYLFGLNNPTPVTLIAGFLAVLCGAALLLGLLTPYTGLLIGLGSIAVASHWIPAISQNFLDTGISNVFLLSMSTALALLGPGAYSLDARLFGRREIFIKQASRQPKQ